MLSALGSSGTGATDGARRRDARGHTLSEESVVRIA